MTYCVAMKLKAGLVCLSDTRTNAGLDNISKFKKMFTWDVPGERAMTIMTAGNLSITQSVIAALEHRIFTNEPDQSNLLNCASMFEAAELVASELSRIQDKYGPGLIAAGEQSGATLLLAGQVRGGVNRGGDIRLFQIYSTGNFIEALDDTSYFQLGEHKYGKPILDRMVHPDLDLDTAKLVAQLSMDSTVRSNLSVGLPLDLSVLPLNDFAFKEQRRISADDPDFQKISKGWSDALGTAVDRIKGTLGHQGQASVSSPFDQDTEIQVQQQQQQFMPQGGWRTR